MRGRPKGSKDTKPRKRYNCRGRNPPSLVETPPTLFSTTPTETPVIEIPQITTTYITHTPFSLGSRNFYLEGRLIKVKKCSARIQSLYDIDGWCQCSRDIYSDGLCKQHYKMDRKAKSPCSTKFNGTAAKGIFLGRVNDWQDNIVGILPYKDSNNILRIRWYNTKMTKIINDALKSGSVKEPPKGSYRKDIIHIKKSA